MSKSCAHARQGSEHVHKKRLFEFRFPNCAGPWDEGQVMELAEKVYCLVEKLRGLKHVDGPLSWCAAYAQLRIFHPKLCLQLLRLKINTTRPLMCTQVPFTGLLSVPGP